jgi:3-hydroxypropanoate dehydrogenase
MRLGDATLDTIFRTARTANRWHDTPVDEDTLREVYELVKWGPTSANSFPLRIVFVASEAARVRLVPLVFANNQLRVREAPVTAILAYDTRFYEWLPRLFPHNPAMASSFVDKPEFAERSAFRNGTLQAAYFMIAARALGLDCGPMSGFDNEGVDREFFPEGRVKSNCLCALGQGDPSGLFDRLPRPEFDEVATIL